MSRLWRLVAWVAGLAVVIVLLTPFLSTSLTNKPRDKDAQSASGTGKHGNEGPVPVLTAQSRQADVPVYVEGVGTGLALNSDLIRSQVDGILLKLNFIEGQDVKAGDVLAQIDPRIYQATLDQNIAKKAQDEAILANAKVDLARYKLLASTKAGTQQQYDTQKATVAQDEAQVLIDQALIDSARTTLSYTNITSPISGRTGIRKVDVGNLIHATDTTGIVTVSQIQPISVIFNVPQQELPRINKASLLNQLDVQATDALGANVVDHGTLAVVDNTIDQTTGTVKLKANFPNPQLQLWPGIFVNVRLKVETLHDVIVVPVACAATRTQGAVRLHRRRRQGGDAAGQGRSAGRHPGGADLGLPGEPAGDHLGLPEADGRRHGQADARQGTRRDAIGGAGIARARPVAPDPRRAGAGRAAAAAPRSAPERERMNVSAIFITRPIATFLLAVAVLLGGVLGYTYLSVSALPQVDFPTIQITTQLPGANPDTMAVLVTAPLERQLGQIPSLTTLTSSSAFGLSEITLQFDLNRDIDGAAQDVQAAINAAASTLPKNLPYPPVYSKVNPADTAVIEVALTSKTIAIRDMSDLADTLIGQRLSELAGVGHVGILGGLRPAVRIQADLSRLAEYGVGMEDIRTAISNANVAGAKGSLDGTQQAYTIGANDQLEVAAQYKPVVITYRNGAPVLIGDVAKVVDGLENAHVAGWYNGTPAIIIDVQRQPGANVVQTVQRIKAELGTLKAQLPAGVDLSVVSDRTTTIKASIADVQFTLILSVVLVVLVVLVFLRSIRATIIAGVALPLSLIATFGVMYFMGFSLDNLSLMALTIGTGFVVDDAIVMIENIVRHLELGERPLQAALKGAREIGFTVISLTVSLIAVFIPLLFMTGIVGRMFREFALVLTIAVVASAIVSLTLTPMMCGQLLRHTPEDLSRPPGRLARLGERLNDRYRSSLEWVLAHQALMLLVTFGTLAATIALYITIPKGFLPPQDTGLISAVTDADSSVSFDEMSRLQGRVAATIRKDPAVAGVTSVVGVGTVNATPNSGRLSIVLKPRSTRVGVATIIKRLRDQLADVPKITVAFQSVQDIQITAQSSRAQYQYTLNGTKTREVSEWSNKLVDALRKSPVLRDVTSEAQDGGLQLYLDIDRKLAGRLGISVQNINDTLYDAFGQRQVSTIYGQSNQYRVILEAEPRYLADANALKNLYVSSNTAAQVPLSTFVKLTHNTAPLSVQHAEQFPAVTISFNLGKGEALSDGVAAIDAATRAIGMPQDITGGYTGDAAEFASSLADEPWLILAAAITIYIVLGVLYESAIHPITILSTLPSAGVGALLALMAFRMDLSLIGLIGIVLLMGIVKKNAIMIIDFALDAERHEGLAPHDAIVQASLLRFRPIMMTTLAALFGALPLAFATGTGSELRNPLGISIVGGLLLSQLITLYTTPVIYVAMEGLRARFFGRKTQRDADAEEAEDYRDRRAAE